jgi:hypothetical protein
MARLFEEEGVLADGHLVRVDVIGGQRDRVSGGFGRIAIVAPHGEGPAGDQHHRRTVAVADDLDRPA